VRQEQPPPPLLLLLLLQLLQGHMWQLLAVVL
jgi:hypothetical protein